MSKIKPILTASAIALILTGCGSNDDPAANNAAVDSPQTKLSEQSQQQAAAEKAAADKAAAEKAAADKAAADKAAADKEAAEKAKKEAEEKAKKEAEEKAKEEAKKLQSEDVKRQVNNAQATTRLEEDIAKAKAKALITFDEKGVLAVKVASKRGDIQDAGNEAIVIKENKVPIAQSLPDGIAWVKEVESLILRDGEKFGWSYQTFGVDRINITDIDKGFAYVSIGKSLQDEAAIPASATYKGIAMGKFMVGHTGDLGVIADMTAVLKDKTIQFNLSNSLQVYFDPDKGNIFGQLYACSPTCDFSDTLTWKSGSKSFTGKYTQAYLYGPNGEEIGGTFRVPEKTGWEGDYLGAFGGKKE